MQAVQGRMSAGVMTFAASALQYAYHPYMSQSIACIRKLSGFAAAGPRAPQQMIWHQCIHMTPLKKGAQVVLSPMQQGLG